MVTAVLVASLVLGLWLLLKGHRGTAVDDHPVCTGCGFDLTCREPSSSRCPECGRDLTQADGVRIGNREPRPAVLTTGAVLMVLAGVPLGSAALLWVTSTDPVRFKPVWWLLRDGLAWPNPYFNKDAIELAARVRADRLSWADDQRVTRAALGLQADLRRAWDPLWGDMVESMHARGQVPTADWAAYLSHDQPAQMTVRPQCEIGGPIPFEVIGELRGATPIVATRQKALPSIWLSVPGAVTRWPSWGYSGASPFSIQGTVELTPASAADLRPGPQTLQVTLGGLGGIAEPDPSLVPPITYSGGWTLEPRGHPTVTLFHDEALAEAVRRTLTVTISGRAPAEVHVRSDRSPVALTFNVAVRVGSDEWTEPQNWISLGKLSPCRSGCIVSPTHSLPDGCRAEVDLRPSPTAAARTVSIVRLLDHVFTFRDVVIER